LVPFFFISETLRKLRNNVAASDLSYVKAGLRLRIYVTALIDFYPGTLI